MATQKDIDGSRFKKTYSFLRQEPRQVGVTLKSSGRRDMTRFRKVSSFTRVQPLRVVVTSG